MRTGYLVHIYFILLITLLNFQNYNKIVFSWDINDKNNPKSKRKGVIVTLTKYWRVDRLITRNRHILKNLYDPTLMDMIIFHQSDIDNIRQEKIQSATKEMPIKFVSVDTFFQLHTHNASKFHNPICPPHKISLMTHPGYKTMCAFWAYTFRDYMLPYKNIYDWMLRIDDDCYIQSYVKDRFPPIESMSGKIRVMSANWLHVGENAPDSLRDENPNHKKNGLLVRGLKKFTYDFAKTHNVSRNNKDLFPIDINNSYSKLLADQAGVYSIYDIPETKLNWSKIENYEHRRGWPSPATNTLYVNLTWLFNEPLILEYMDAIEESKCVFSNR